MLNDPEVVASQMKTWQLYVVAVFTAIPYLLMSLGRIFEEVENELQARRRP